MALPRAAKKEEIDKLIALSDRTFRRPGQTSMGEAYAGLLSQENAENLLVMEEDGIPAALVGLLESELSIAGCTVSAVSMGSVCTEPEYRGKHFADTLVKMAIDRCSARGIPFLLVSGTLNLYRRNDCLEVGSVRNFTLPADGRWQTLAGRNGFARRYEGAGDIPAMLRLLEAEKAYYRRTEEQMDRLLRSAAVLSNYMTEQQVLLHVNNSGEADGYIVFGVREKQGASVAQVVEFAGSDEAVLALLGEIAQAHRPDQVQIPVMPDRHSLAEKLALAGCMSRETPIPGTVRVTHFANLWAALRPYRVSRIGESAVSRLECAEVPGGFRLGYGGETLTLDHRGATSLVLNGPQLTEPSELKAMLAKLFPIPFVYTANLNYV